MLPHPTSADLVQYVNGKLSAEESSTVQTHLETCEDCQLKLVEIALQSQWTGPERRRQPRIPVDFKGRLKLLDPVTSVGPPHDVEVVEISRDGLKVRTPRLLLEKTLVQIRFNGKAVLGEVRYCNETEEGYIAGLLRKDDFPSD